MDFWLADWPYQRMVVDGESSSEAAVISGVPQGTVIRPLMFILYIIDIDNETSSSIRLFSDDCLLYRTVSCTRDASELQRDLKQMCRWADLWHMNFNATKGHVLSVRKKAQPLMFPYTIGGQQLQHVTHHPYLGVELANDLSWGPHLDKMIPKAQRTLNLLRQNLSDCSQNTKDVAYKTLVRPVLEYASTVICVCACAFSSHNCKCWPLTCGGCLMWIDQYHDRWCPGSLCYQVISAHDIENEIYIYIYKYIYFPIVHRKGLQSPTIIVWVEIINMYIILSPYLCILEVNHKSW